jgi:hypothetical protein
MVLDRDIPAFNGACFAQAFSECGQITRRGVGCSAVDEADHWEPLRARREWQRGRAAERG